MRKAQRVRGQNFIVAKHGTSVASVSVLLVFAVLWTVWLYSRSNSGNTDITGHPTAAQAATVQQQAAGAALAAPASCTPREAVVQAGFFRALWEGEGFTTHTRCPSFSYLLDVAAVLSPTWGKKDIVMFDIGCNKGYDTAMAFELWRPSTGLSRQTLGQFIQKTRSSGNADTAKGVCSDADQGFGEAYETYTPPPAGSQGGLQVHCFEPSALNYDLLQQVQRHFFGGLPQRDQQRLQVGRFAFSNFTGTTFFSPNCNTESCHIQEGTGDKVNVTTVDAMVQQLQLKELFLLKIDTEGFDPLVLQGAHETLAARKVTILQFEYHSLGVWGKHKLGTIVEWLGSFGYVCYFDGTLLTLLTDCWDPLLEFRGWSNVVCTLKGSVVHKVLASYSLVPFHARYRKLAMP